MKSYSFETFRHPKEKEFSVEKFATYDYISANQSKILFP